MNTAQEEKERLENFGMEHRKEIICRYSTHDEYVDASPLEKLGENQEFCRRGVTCNRPSDPLRDDLGLTELEERLSLNFQLLESLNKWMRSPYCQCTYSTGNLPKSESCRYCGRPMTPDSAKELHARIGNDFQNSERIRRLRAGPTWIVVYEFTVRAAEVALKLLIKATAPEPDGQLSSYRIHTLKVLWEILPACARQEILAEMLGSSLDASSPRLITAIGETITEPHSAREQPVFEKFGTEFNTVRYAWDRLPKEGIDRFNELAREWPDPIELYYLHLWTQGVVSVLNRKPWDSESKYNRWNRAVRLNLGAGESSFHSDWPRVCGHSD